MTSLSSLPGTDTTEAPFQGDQVSPELLPPPDSGTCHVWLILVPDLPVAMRILSNLSELAATWAPHTQTESLASRQCIWPDSRLQTACFSELNPMHSVPWKSALRYWFLWSLFQDRRLEKRSYLWQRHKARVCHLPIKWSLFVKRPFKVLLLLLSVVINYELTTVDCNSFSI